MNWARPRQLIVLLVAVTLVPMSVLAWLTVRMLSQERDVERQRESDALEVDAGRVALGIERRLQDLESELARGEGVRLTDAGVVAPSESPLLFQPQSAHIWTDRPGFAAADADAQQGRPSSAVQVYRALSKSRDVTVRADALLRLGSTLRKIGDRAGALDAYTRLEALNETPAAGVPASLQASLARGRLAETAGDGQLVKTAGTELSAKLTRGGWAIDRATFESYAAAAVRWGGAPMSADAIARSEAVATLWTEWLRGALPAEGRRVVSTSASPAVAVWTDGPDGPVVRVLNPDELASWLEPAWSDRPVSVAAFEVDGGAIFGEVDAGGVSLLPRDTRLPFAISVAAVSDGSDSAGRRAVFVTGVGLACVLMLAAAVGLYRTTTREVTLARQQSDFVSAVSHEFRTPLTSMRHILDFLTNRGITSEERRSHYYGLLTEETERLRRMVETLLSFGRIEAGAYAWQLNEVDVAALADRTVGEFRREPAGRNREIRLDIAAGLPLVMADREALARALWNLIENAVKYSDPHAPVTVFARATDTTVEVGVRDLGPGIPVEERAHIFDKFVRGSGARQAGARGVGIGLALVKMIVAAHHGSIAVDSTVGEGSTFTITLPGSAGDRGLQTPATV